MDSSKQVDADSINMTKMDKPRIQEIKEYLKEIDLLFEEASRSTLFAEKRIDLTCRLSSLKKELEIVIKYNMLGKELFAHKLYIETLFNYNPTSKEIKPNIDRLIAKVDKIDDINFKNKWALVSDSLLNDYIKLESESTLGCCDCNDKSDSGNDFQSNSDEPSVPTFSTPNVSAEVEEEKQKESVSAIFDLNNRSNYNSDKSKINQVLSHLPQKKSDYNSFESYKFIETPADLYADLQPLMVSLHTASEKIRHPCSREKVSSNFELQDNASSVSYRGITRHKFYYYSTPQKTLNDDQSFVCSEKQSDTCADTSTQFCGYRNNFGNGDFCMSTKLGDDFIDWGASPSTYANL